MGTKFKGALTLRRQPCTYTTLRVRASLILHLRCLPCLSLVLVIRRMLVTLEKALECKRLSVKLSVELFLQ